MRIFWLRLLECFNRERRERRLADEIQSHLDLLTDEVTPELGAAFTRGGDEAIGDARFVDHRRKGGFAVTRRALERDEAAIEHWRKHTWPALKKTPDSKED